jgi:thioredoxin 1
MPSNPHYSPDAPSRVEVDDMRGPVLLDFGTDWCGHCRAARSLVDAALAPHPAVRHLRIEDGPGRRLGRSFGVKLWPTLVFLLDGREVDRVIRPRDAGVIHGALARIDPTG